MKLWLYSYRDPAVQNVAKHLLKDATIVGWKLKYKSLKEQYKGTLYENVMDDAVLNILNQTGLFYSIAETCILAKVYRIESYKKLRDMMLHTANNDPDIDRLKKRILKAVVAIYPYKHPIYKEIYYVVKDEMLIAKDIWGIKD